MSRIIRNQADLDRANIQVAWSMAHTMTDAQFAELCRVSCQALHEGIEDPDLVLGEVLRG